MRRAIPYQSSPRRQRPRESAPKFLGGRRDRPRSVLRRHDGRALELGWEDLEQHVHHGCVGLVLRRVGHVSGLEEEVARPVDDGLVRQHVRHVARGHLPNAGARVVMLANVPARLEHQLRYAQLVLAIELRQVPRQGALELDLGGQPLVSTLGPGAVPCAAAGPGNASQVVSGAAAKARSTSRRVGPSVVMVWSSLAPHARLWSRTGPVHLANRRWAMYEYGQYCPVARASEILADRWTPLIVRELLAGVCRFNDLDRGSRASRVVCLRSDSAAWSGRASCAGLEPVASEPST